eukprot:CAMPEP_0115130364 /NCGR_PEP_ID=MMETSP0227-20121206/52427_1 /TAXON_ID=89957 /ORGANISM="Polarella glacialis, Strain CCMP 1383" /LENGTH=37 /DNA_ID= /DNA_START= /DNA_END= /DNA_ORIENTATION=
MCLAGLRLILDVRMVVQLHNRTEFWGQNCLATNPEEV